MKNAVVTFIYPYALKYLDEFEKCLSIQTFKDFDLVIFNDGVSDLKEAISGYNDHFEIISVSGTPMQIRFEAFGWLNKSGYDKIIFQDIDDSMSSNRVECLINLLNSYEIVANDLSLMNEKGDIYEESVWSKELGDLFSFNYEFISDKNILGIGNSAIRRQILEVPIKQSSTPVVADWFIYYQLLHNGRLSAIFTNQCQTYYRQHEDNMAGIKEFSEDRLNYVIKVKEAQYNGLKEVGIELKNEMEVLAKQKESIDRILDLNKNRSRFFWWDETTIQ